MKITPRTKKDFLWTRWKPQDIRAAVPTILAEKKRRYARIKAIPDGERTFENTVGALERAGSAISDRIHCIDFLMNVSSDDAVRTVAHEAITKLQSELIELEYDGGVWRGLTAYEKKKPRERLNGADKKLLDDTLRDYRRMGFALSSHKREILKENTKKLVQQETAFQKNINDYHDHIILPPSEADGLSAAYRAGLKKDARGNYLVSLAYPDYFPFLQNFPHENRRRELIDKYLQKGGTANIKMLNEILALRDDNAKLLGYRNHAAFRVEIKMAKKPEAVFSFLNGLAKKLEKGTARELSAVRALKRTMTSDSNAELSYYDIASSAASYYMNELKKQTLALDDEEIRAYFPLERVLAGMMGVYEKLLSVKFIPLSGYPLWHKDVMLYGIRNEKEKGNGIRAYFAMDLHPREGKYGHAAAFEIFGGRAERSGTNENYRAPFAALVCNFRKPTKQTSSLLSHSEVETLFHEFGHIMHQTLTTARWESQSGSNAAQDFVEAPSQMLENWVWDESMLKHLSGHYRNKNKKLPQHLIKKLAAAKNFMASYDATRQCVLALFDLRIHTERAKKPIADLFGETFRELFGTAMPRDHLWPAGFGHLAGYDAGYYGYLWSKVYAADMFTRFARVGLLDKKTGMAYRKNILEVGSSRDERASLTAFLGRKPNEKAFLKALGL